MTHRFTRRTFLGAGAGAAAAFIAPSWLRFAGRDAAPDLVVHGAKVYTIERALPVAEAFAVKNGRFVAVGKSVDVRALAGPRTRVVDARGMTIVPGFIDTHVHADGTTLLYEVLVGNPFEVEFVTIDSIIEKLRARAEKTPPGTWVEGFFFDDTKLKDKRALHRKDLDRVSTEHPVAVHHRGGHTAFYNSKALALANVTKATVPPRGGTFDRDAEGELSGRVTDAAMDVVDRVGRRPTFTPAQTAQRERDGLAHISKQFVRYGLTSVHHEGGDLVALQDVRARGDLRHRVSYEPSERQFGMADALSGMVASGLQTGFGDEWIRIGATSEHLVDGSFSERTMALSVPYPNRQPPYKGNIVPTQEQLDAWVLKMHRAGIQVNCHANGDVGIDMYLTALERAQRAEPRTNTRPKITHCTLVTPELVRRIKALGAVPAMFSTYAYYNSDKFPFYGEDLLKRAMAYRWMLDAGVPATGGSDFSPGPFAVLMGIQGMVTRTGWDGKTWGANQRITVDDALRVTTINGAYASHEETLKGSIAEGKLADFVVLAEDPHTVAPEKIKDIKIVRTVVGGTTMYEA